MEIRIIGLFIVALIAFGVGIAYIFFQDWAWDDHEARMRRRARN